MCGVFIITETIFLHDNIKVLANQGLAQVVPVTHAHEAGHFSDTTASAAGSDDEGSTAATDGSTLRTSPAEQVHFYFYTKFNKIVWLFFFCFYNRAKVKVEEVVLRVLQESIMCLEGVLPMGIMCLRALA